MCVVDIDGIPGDTVIQAAVDTVVECEASGSSEDGIALVYIVDITGIFGGTVIQAA